MLSVTSLDFAGTAAFRNELRKGGLTKDKWWSNISEYRAAIERTVVSHGTHLNNRST